jgi:hypothetical protein
MSPVTAISRHLQAYIITVFSVFMLSSCLEESSDVEISEAEEPTTQARTSPDDIWTFIDPPEFPADYSPPTEYAVAAVDDAVLQAVLNTAPAELNRDPALAVQMTLPLPDESFSFFDIARTQMMEAALAAQFPQLSTYRFESIDQPTVSGHLTTGMSKLYAAGTSVNGLLRIDPVMSRTGMVYVVYYDRNRTDGLNEFEHVLNEQEEAAIPPVPKAARGSMDVLQDLTFEKAMWQQVNANLQAKAVTGSILRTFRFTATTTGEFYQNNDTGNGDVDVIQSLLQRINAVNAVMEPEISVRLILAANTLDVLFNDPTTDGIDDGDAPCNLRETNQVIAQANLNEADYDIGFLFSTGSSGGCAWYVVCEDSVNGFPAHEKARGAGHFGTNGTGLGTGLILHETGHQLGAKHTYSGQTSGCNAPNFDGDDGTLPSAFEPGSGTTIMSYYSSCGSDNVDISTNTNGQYYHAMSQEQIVDNLTSGNGLLCGGSLNTGNTEPSVNAGPDYTIPRQTPFTLTGSGSDPNGDPLKFAWEQIDLATTQRPIDTDDGIGPIIRSIPPLDSPSRTVPDIRDLLNNNNQPRNGVNLAGELVPQVDRTVNFRFTGRDGLAGGGGVNSDDMVLNVSGAPFYITSPNSGSILAGCAVPVTWEVGGGNIAANVDILYSTTGGLAANNVDESFPDIIALGTANDGEYDMPVPCTNTSKGRIKVMASDNIFFDVNDNNLSVYNEPPVSIVNPIADGEVDQQCQFTVNFTAKVTDSCGVNAADVEVIFDKKPPGDYTLGTPSVNIAQNGVTQVDVSGSILVSDLLSSPAVLAVGVKGTDNCGASNVDFYEVEIADNMPPEIEVSVSPDTLWPPNHKMEPIQATVTATDNCPGVSYVLKSITSDEPDNGTGDGDTVNDIQNADYGTPDIEFDLRSERTGNQDGRTYTITYSASDNGNNSTDDSATVEVPHNKKP